MDIVYPHGWHSVSETLLISLLNWFFMEQEEDLYELPKWVKLVNSVIHGADNKKNKEE